MKIQVLMAALLSAAGITLSAAPKVEGNTIVSGDKKVVCAKNGNLVISDAKGQIVRIACHYSVVNPSSKKTDWTTIRDQDCTMTFKDKKYTWVLNRKSFGKSWKAVDQTLEILPDGRLKLTIQEYPAPAGLKLYDNCVFMTFPLPRFNGKTIQYKGKDVKLDAGTKDYAGISLPNVRGFKGTTYTFPLDKGSLTISSGCWGGISAYNKSKELRMTWYMSLPKSAEFIIDIK